MGGEIQIIAGILAAFFLCVAIAKYLAQRARKREALAKSLAESGASADVELHNPFSGDDAQAEEEAAPDESSESQQAAPDSGAQSDSEQPQQAESPYKWV